MLSKCFSSFGWPSWMSGAKSFFCRNLPKVCLYLIFNIEESKTFSHSVCGWFYKVFFVYFPIFLLKFLSFSRTLGHDLDDVWFTRYLCGRSSRTTQKGRAQQNTCKYVTHFSRKNLKSSRNSVSFKVRTKLT